MGESGSETGPAETGRSIDHFLEAAHADMSACLKRLGFIEKVRLGASEQGFVTSSKYKALRLSRLSALPFPLNHPHALLLVEHNTLKGSEALKIQWEEKNGVYHEVLIESAPLHPRARSEEGPYYSHETGKIQDMTQRTPLKSITYHNGRLEDATNGFLPLSLHQWSMEQAIIGSLLSSLRAAADPGKPHSKQGSTPL